MAKKIKLKKNKEGSSNPEPKKRNATRPPAWDGTHTCGGCDAKWKSMSAAHCAGCHRTFSSVSLFDAHRSTTGEHGRCLDPATLTNNKGERTHFWREASSGFMWRGPEMTEEQKKKITGGKNE